MKLRSEKSIRTAFLQPSLRNFIQESIPPNHQQAEKQAEWMAGSSPAMTG